MCGIFFSIGFGIPSSQVIDSVTHRGPDGRGWNEFISPYGHVIMAHRRLSIVDLSYAGHQPMASEDGRYWVTYNGEIYNYVELKQELESHGYKFKSYTDTEVLLKSYIHWGMSCLNKLNGMFAFVVWDDREKKAFIARDRFGVKPLYCYRQGQKIAFASEIKQFTYLQGFEAKLNKEHFAYFILNKYHPISNTTLFKNVKRIEPGQCAFYQNKELLIQKWYDPALVCNNDSDNPIEFEDFRSLFSDSIQKRLIADVPTGALLSGGLDSSSIVCMIFEIFKNHPENLKEITTFTSWSDHPEVDESEYSDAVNEKTGFKNIKALITSTALQDDLEKIIYHQEEPFLSTSIHSEWNIYKTIKSKTKLRVVLDGQGADELLCGYLFMIPQVFSSILKEHQYITFIKEIFLLWKKHANFPIKNLIIDLMAQIYPLLFNRIQSFRGREFNPDSVEHFKNFSQYTLHLIRQSIEPQLHWQDRSSMAFSIESRQPFLDYRIVEKLLQIPINQKFNNGMTKVLLRDSMHMILPDKVRNRKTKFGFPSPQKSLLSSIQPDFYLKYYKKGEDIIKTLSLDSFEISDNLQDSCLKLTTGIWAEKFGISL